MTFKRWALVLVLGAWTAAGCSASSSGKIPTGGDPTLQALVVSADSAVAMFPAFDPSIHLYDVVLSADTRTATVTATPMDPSVRTVSLGELPQGVATAPAGAPASFLVPDQGDAATLRVVVTSPDGSASTGYTLRVTRRSGIGTDATLASLTDNKGLLHFVPSTTSYADTYTLEQAAGFVIAPLANDPLASVTVNGQAAAYTATVPLTLATGSNTVSIVVTSQDKAKQTTYTLALSVTDQPVAVSGVTLSASQYRLDTVSSTTGKLAATVAPTAAGNRQVAWSSSNTSIVAVDTTGKLTAGSTTGHATVTATTSDGGFTATCEVYVFKPYWADNFEGGVTHMENWTILANPSNTTGNNGTFSVGVDGSNVLAYSAGNIGTGGVLATAADWSGVTSGDYYVEARIKPLTNSTTGNKKLYLLARYQDANNFYAAGLNVQSSTTSTKVEIAKSVASSTPAVFSGASVSRPISIGTWYTVRFELLGSKLSVYLDGELIASVTDTNFTAGRIGLFTANKSFEIDDVKVGDPADRPMQLTVTPATDYVAEAGDAPRTVTVNAQKPDYSTGTYSAEAFTVSNSNVTALLTPVSGTTVSLAPVSAGTATVTFQSASNPAVKKVMNATISPMFVQPTAVYDLSGKTVPVAGDPGAYADTRLSLTFDSPPTIGTTGSVRIFRKSDDLLVDVIKLAGDVQVLGYAGQSNVRAAIVSSPLTVSGNTVTIRPHDFMTRDAANPKLAYGTEYYVAVGKGVITGTTLNGTAFTGIGKAANWSFTTRPAPATTLTTLTVDDDGSAADFRTVQGALDYFMQYALAATPVTINVMNGTYDELLYLRNKNNVTIKGESRDGVVIQFKNYDTLNTGSGASQTSATASPGGGRSVFLVEGADLLELDTLTLRNTMARSPTASSQAETIYFNNDTGRLIAKNSAFYSEQDTLQLKGWNWFYQCVVAGNVDFIWGASHAALFEESEIRSLGDSTSTTSGGYVVQARVAAATDKGFVFLNSALTHGAGPAGNDVPAGTTYLARSPGGTSTWDNVAYVNCRMDNHVIPVGWAYNVNSQPVPNPATATAASGWREYGTTDVTGLVPFDLTRRVGGYTLTSTDYGTGFSTRAQIFAAYNGGAGWTPAP